MSPTDPYPMKTLGSLELNGNNAHAPAATPAPASAEPAALPPALSAPPGLDTAWHILRRRWLFIVSVGLVAAAVGAAIAWFVTPGKYSTYAIIHLESRNPRTGTIDPDEFTNFQRAQIAALKSNEVLNRLLVKPDIAELSEMQKHKGSELEWLQKDLDVETLMGPEILRVKLTGDNPEDIAKILNALIPIYKERFDTDLNNQIDKLRNNARDLDREISNSATRIGGPGGDLRNLEWDQQDLQAKITGLQLQLAQMQAQMRKDAIDKADLERKRTNPADLVKDLDVLERLDQDYDIRPLREELAKQTRDMQESIRISGNQATAEPFRKRIAVLEKDIENLHAKNSERIRKALQEKEVQKLNVAIADLEKNLVLRKKDEEDLKKEMTVCQSELNEVRGKIFDLRLREERNQNAGLAKELTRKRLADELSALETSKSTAPRVEFKELAEVPTLRQTDRKVKFAGGTAVALFGLVLLGVFLVEFKDRRISSPHDVAFGLGLRVIGTLPYQHAPGAVSEAEQFAMLEAADGLRTVVLQAARNDGVRVVMVTSAGTGEGKTSLACQLATSLGRAGRRTLLIDADLRNPAAHTQFNVPLTPGFAEALRGEIDPDDTIKPTNVPSLSLLPAGQYDHAAIQALAQDEVQTLFYHLKEEHEFVILDISPVLPVADALVIGQYADAVLFSVLRDVSKLPLVYEAQQRLAALGIRMLGVVVSGERPRTYGRRPLVLSKAAEK